MERPGEEAHVVMTWEARSQVGNSGLCQQCFDACDHDYAPCPMCAPCFHYREWKAERVGDFNFGSYTYPGLSKLVEECGELMQIAGKLMSTGGRGTHWAAGNLHLAFAEELADLKAAIEFIQYFVPLDAEQFKEYEERVRSKLAKFHEWHKRVDLPPEEKSDVA